MRRLALVLSALAVALLVGAGPGVGAASRQAPPTVPENATADELIAAADKLLADFKGNLALPFYTLAAERARQQMQEPQEAQARFGLARVLFYRTEYRAAREHALGSAEIFERLELPREIGRVKTLLSGIEQLLGRVEDARTHAKEAMAALASTNDFAGRATAALQFLRVTDLDLDAQRGLYAEAAADARAAGDLALEGQVVHSLGDHLFTASRFDEALDALLQAESILLGTTDFVALGTTYNSLGRVYRAHGRFDEALRFQLKALALHEKVNSPFEVIQSANAVATIYERLGDTKEATDHFERALALAGKSSSQRIQDFVRANFASLLVADGQYARAARELEAILARGLDAYPSRRRRLLSLTYSKLGRPREALTAAMTAVGLCGDDVASCVEALGRRAASHADLGDASAALVDLNSALEQIERVRVRLVPSDFFKQDFNYAQQYIYSQAIALQVRERQPRQALETAELARSRAFIDLLASRAVQMKERDRPAIAALRQEAPAAPPRFALPRPPAAPAPALTFRGAGRRSSEVAPPPSARDLELRSVAVATPSTSEDLVATAARLRSTMLAYWVGEDQLFIWVVSADGDVQVRRVPVTPARLLALARDTSPLMESGAAASVRAIPTRGDAAVPMRGARATAWRALYDVLIRPVRSALPTTRGALLTIVPQGPLLNVSFAALQNAQGRFLLEDYAIHYAPAGAVLQFTAPKKRADARTGSMLVVADPALPKLSNLDRPLQRLPGARGEAADIARLVPASQVTVLRDGVATEARTRELLAGKAVLHFATHAVAKDEDPFASFLALGPSPGGGAADGLLTTQEVYGLDLHADLVVLSACRSAGGRVAGDGISAFARAFIYAGTASVVLSLWDVADEPTNRLLPDFYRRWLAGESKDRALRGAQLRLLRDLRAGRVRIDTPAGVVSLAEHPVFWAGFALFGEPE